MSEQPSTPRASADDESVDIQPRPAALVARRATLIAALLRRTALELGLTEGDPDAERFDLAAWTAAEGLPALATADEAAALTAPLGALDTIQVEDATWEAEALVALAWSLGLIETMPPYDEIANPLVALDATPVPWDSLAKFASSAKLRSVEALATERERAEVWRWRSLMEMAKRGAAADQRREWVATIRDFAREVAEADLIAAPRDDDFPIGARPYHRVSDDDLEELAEIARQRLRALNWCCGFGESWQDDEALDVRPEAD